MAGARAAIAAGRFADFIAQSREQWAAKGDRPESVTQRAPDGRNVAAFEGAPRRRMTLHRRPVKPDVQKEIWKYEADAIPTVATDRGLLVSIDRRRPCRPRGARPGQISGSSGARDPAVRRRRRRRRHRAACCRGIEQQARSKLFSSRTCRAPAALPRPAPRSRAAPTAIR